MTAEEDVAWAPAVPPGHTLFSWDLDQFETQAQLQKEATPAPVVRVHTSSQSTQRSIAPAKPATTSKPAAAPKPEAKRPPVDTSAITAKITAAVKSWGQTDEKGELELTSELTVLENGSLKWNKEEKRGIESIPAEQLELLQKEVEECIATKKASISQGLHDKYMQYVMNKPEGARQHGHIGKGHSLYLQGLSALHGIGVPINKKSAVLFLHQAAADGVPEAISLLGYCYELGDGVGENPARAVECYRAALELGDPHAAVRLGRCLWTGLPGVLEADRTRAPQLIEEGLAELRERVARKQDGTPGVSLALSLLHSQMNLV